MKLSELSEKDLKTIKEWQFEDSYKIIFALVRNIKNSNASLLWQDIENSKSQWEVIKKGMARAYRIEGLKEILEYPRVASKLLDTKKK